MNTIGFGATDVGRKRTNNQDGILVNNELGVFAVADGMGGHAAGEVASRLALETLSTHLERERSVLVQAATATDPAVALGEVARTAVLAACAAIHSAASSDDSLRGMGTTITALITAGPHAVIAHVGDSRAYLLRGGSAHQLTTDHTFAAELARLGVITPEEVKKHPHAHVLTRVLGTQPVVSVEVLATPLVAGDRFILSSDGLTEYLPELTWLATNGADERADDVADRLVAFANEAGGEDNISVICVDVNVDADDSVVMSASENAEAQIAAVTAIPLFEGLRLADRTRLLNLSQAQEFTAGERVFKAGDSRRGLIAVLGGSFRLESKDRPPRQLSPGDYIGASTLVHPRPARRDLVCETDGQLLFFWAASFAELVQRRPWLGLELYAHLGVQLATELEKTLLSNEEGRDESARSPEWF